MAVDTITLIKKYYPEGSDIYKTLLIHSVQVSTKALAIAKSYPSFQLDLEFIVEASMLHDIGMIFCNAPNIHCYGKHQYVEHGYLGAELLRKEGLDKHALVCERHTGTGISLEMIVERNLPLPHRNMQPVSLEEQVICYADKFFSKTKLDRSHSLNHIVKHLSRYGNKSVEIFEKWHAMFATEDE